MNALAVGRPVKRLLQSCRGGDKCQTCWGGVGCTIYDECACVTLSAGRVKVCVQKCLLGLCSERYEVVSRDHDYNVLPALQHSSLPRPPSSTGASSSSPFTVEVRVCTLLCVIKGFCIVSGLMVSMPSQCINTFREGFICDYAMLLCMLCMV